MTRRERTLGGIAVFAAVWQGLWLIGDANLRRLLGAESLEPAMILLAASMVMWLAIWPSLFGPLRNWGRLRMLQIGSMIAVVVAGLLLLGDTSAVGSDGWIVGASVLNLGAGLAGLYLKRTIGVPVVLVIVALEVGVIGAMHLRIGDPWPLEVDLIFPFYALALGLASAASRHALMESALSQDMAQRLIQRQQQARQVNELTDATVMTAETRVHESVLNTLTAIVRGGLSDDEHTRNRLRERARESADVLRAIADGSDFAARWSGDLRVDLAGTIVDLESSGIAVDVKGLLDLDMLERQIDVTTFPAVGSAVREALINVLRHSQAERAQVIGDIHRGVDGIWWRIRIRDDGRGFDVHDRGFGLRSVIEEAVADCGGRVSIKSGRGTTITIEIPMATAPAALGTAWTGNLQAIAVPVVTAFTAFTLFTVGATWQYVGSAANNTLAVALFIVTAAVVLIATRDRHRAVMPWWGVGIALVAVPAMVFLERLVPSAANPTGDWSSEAGSALLFVVVATGPWWAAPAAALSWFVAQDTRWIELTQPGMFVIVVAAVLGWQLRRGERRTRDMDAEVSEERVALAASQQRLAQARRRYRDVDTTRLIALLDAIADNQVDPQSPKVKSTCRREERMIRSVIRLHPESIAVHRDLVALATAARDADIDLSISVVEQLPEDAHLRTHQQARALIELAEPGSQARASIARDQHGCVFRLVVKVRSTNYASLPPGVEVLDDNECLVSLEEICGSGHNADMDTGRSELQHDSASSSHV